MAGRFLRTAQAGVVTPVSFTNSSRRQRRNLTFPKIEPLEERCTPAIFKPTIFTDGGAGSGSLRAAIIATNADTGTATDTIQLKAGTYSLTIRNRRPGKCRGHWRPGHHEHCPHPDHSGQG
jgi:hypothetical protein